MFNPAAFGVTPQQQAAAMEMGKHLKMEITEYRNEGRVEVRFIKLDTDPQYGLPQTVDAFVNMISNTFHMMFNMNGKVIKR